MAKKVKLRIDMKKKGDRVNFEMISKKIAANDLMSFHLALTDFIRNKMAKEMIEEFQGK